MLLITEGKLSHNSAGESDKLHHGCYLPDEVSVDDLPLKETGPSALTPTGFM
jgi:hypothetical protein